LLVFDVTVALPPVNRRRYPFDRRLGGGPESPSGRCGEKKDFFLAGNRISVAPLSSS